MLNPASSTPKPRKRRRYTIHSRRRAGRGCMARSPRQRSVGASAPAAARNSAAFGKPYTFGWSPASVETRSSIPSPVHRTRAVADTMRIARASVGKRARRRRQMPSGTGTRHHRRPPTAASIGRPTKLMTVGVALIT
eukprot:scaffold34433_cov79-Phaeocystis_antarctica.AAC.1